MASKKKFESQLELHSQSILIADNDIVSQRLLSKILEQTGYPKPLLAQTEKEVRKLLKKKPSLVVFDVDLPGTNSLKLLEELYTREAQIPSIALSSNSNFSTVAPALEYQAFWYLQKPINKREFLEVVIRALRFSHLIRQNSLYRKALSKGLGKKLRGRAALTKIVEDEIATIVKRNEETSAHIAVINSKLAENDKSPLESTITVCDPLSLAEIEQQAIIETLLACNGNKARAARCLGISEKSIYNKMRRFNIPFAPSDTTDNEDIGE